MGQHFASLRDFFRMEGEKQSLQVYNESSSLNHQSSFDMLDQEDSENTQKNENNGNIHVPNLNIILNKPDDNLDNEQLNLDVDNHNARFESIYSQPIDTQDSKQNCNNGNIVSAVEPSLKQQESCVNNSGSSNTSSSSEDSPVNPSFRRSSKTLSFGKRKGELLII